MKTLKYIQNQITNNLDRKKISLFTKILFIFVFFCFALNWISLGLSRYESVTRSKAKASVAFFLIESGTYEKKLSLGKIIPSKDKYTYTFTVSNHNSERTTDVSMDYTISFITTTNLPLTYEVYKNETYTNNNAKNLITSEEVFQDENGVYYKKINIDDIGTFTHTENQTDIYNLIVEFKEEYQSNPTNYSGYVDLIKVVVDAKQKMDEGE